MQADWPLIAIRFALYLALGELFGLSAFSLYGLRRDERGNAFALRAWLIGLGITGLILSCVAISLLAAAMAGTPAWPIDHDAISMILSGTSIGTAWKARMVALAYISLVAWWGLKRPLALGSATVASGIALTTLAWTGHGAMDDAATGWVHLVADATHLLAAGAWIGALLALGLMIARPAHRVDVTHLRLTHRALDGFSLAGTIFVATIIVSGLVNAWLLVGIGNLSSLVTTLYGRLLLAKLALFGVMLGLASLNRFRLTPAFGQSIATSEHQGAIRQLRRSLAVETGCAFVILALVAWLGTLAPPASGM